MATSPGHWEAEALPPDVMRTELDAWIRGYVDDGMLAVHKVAEKSERDILRTIIRAAS